MSGKTNVAIAAACGVAVGLLAGLLTASLMSGSLRELTGENQRLKARIEKAPQRSVNAEEWGALSGLSDRAGPGSEFWDFANQLQATGPWNPDHYWVIVAGGTPEAHLSPFNKNVLIEVVADLWHKPMSVDFMFKPKMGPGSLIDGPADRDKFIMADGPSIDYLDTGQLGRIKWARLTLDRVDALSGR